MWAKTLEDIGVSEGSGWNFSSSEPVITNPGDYTLFGDVFTETGQLVSRNEYDFRVIDYNTPLLLFTEKSTYRPQENINVSGLISNNNIFSPMSGTLIVSDNEENILYSETITIWPFQEHNFSFTTSFESSNTLYAEFNELNTEHIILVSVPEGIVEITAPEFAGYAPFNVSLKIENTGIVDLMGEIDFNGDIHSYTLEPMKETLFLNEVTISADTALVWTLTGDIEGVYTGAVEFAESVNIEFTNDEIYSEGIVSIPYVVTNTGRVNIKSGFDLIVEDDAGNPVLMKSAYYEIAPEEIREDFLFGEFTEGNYIASCTSKYGTFENEFSVMPEEGITLEHEILATVNGYKTIRADLGNSGGTDFDGFVILESPIDIIRENIEIDVSHNQTIDFKLYVENFEESVCPFRIRVFNNAGEELAETLGEFEIVPAAFEIISKPELPTYTAGGSENAEFIIRNSGDKLGEASFDLMVGDFYRTSERIILNSGEETELSFEFTVPDDYETGKYYAEYDLDNTLGGYDFMVDGKEINVSVSLDKEEYAIGENAILTLELSNIHTGNPLDLFAWVSNGTFEDQIDFTLVDNKTIVFEVPITSENDYKITYGINLNTGKSLYLSWKYINIFNEDIQFYTDKRLYDQGEMVICTVIVPDTGEFTIKCDDIYSDEMILEDEETVIEFKLPDYMEQDVKRIEYTYKGIGYNHYIQITGIKIAVLDCQFDKAVYKPGATAKVTYVVDANIDVDLILKGYVSGIDTEVFNGSVSIETGKNYITRTFDIDWTDYGSFPLSASFTHPENNRMLSAYTEYFNVMSDDMTC